MLPRSLAIFRAIGGTQNEAILYLNIGSVYQYKGSYEEGLAAYRRALAMYRDMGDLHDEAEVLNEMGVTYQGAECFDEALIYHEKARLIAEEIGNLPQYGVALRGLARVYHGCGRYSEAFDQYHAALKLAKEIGDPYEEAKILDGLAETTLSARAARRGTDPAAAGPGHLQTARRARGRVDADTIEALDLASPGRGRSRAPRTRSHAGTHQGGTVCHWRGQRRRPGSSRPRTRITRCQHQIRVPGLSRRPWMLCPGLPA